ncbi:MAG: DUF1329 domain-containing protein, partial [Deltaproteobacteria bacterium]
MIWTRCGASIPKFHSGRSACWPRKRSSRRCTPVGTASGSGVRHPMGHTGCSPSLPARSTGRNGVWVVEGLPTAYSQYAFSKRIMYIDKDTLGVIFMEAYDQGGELWRVFFNMFSFSKKPYEGYPARPLEGGQYNYEDEWAFDPHGMTADLQTAHGSPWDAPSGYSKSSEWVNEWYFNEP